MFALTHDVKVPFNRIADARARSRDAVYDAGGADRGTTRPRGSRSTRPAPEFGHRFDRHARTTGGRNSPPQVAVITVVRRRSR